MSKKPKITIKPFRQQVQMEPHYAETTWKLLKNAIHEIHKKNASGLSFEELYRNAYNMVLHKYGDMLYEGLKQEVDEHLSWVAQHIISASDHNFLSVLNEAWKDHEVSMIMIRDILMYMDRVYVTQNTVPHVYDLGLVLFRDNIARSPKIKERLCQTLLDMIQRERRGEIINRGLIKNIIQMLVEVGVHSRSVYEEDFEKPFLEATATFYRLESQKFISSNSCPDYLKKVEARRKEELDRVQHYLDEQSSEPKVRDVVERELIFVHMKTLVHMENSGLIPMLRDEKVEDLSRMFALFQKVETGLSLMREVMCEYIKETGKSIVNDVEKSKEPSSFVQSLLELKNKYDNLLRTAFKDDKTFSHGINKAFESFININMKSPEYISLFIDNKLKKGLKGVSEEEIDVLLDQVMTIFRFIQDKDVFEKYYKQHLAKRLLLGKSISDDIERNMIAKLKTECGYQFTSKLEGMFNDMRLSADTMERFREYLRNTERVTLEAEMNVQVLTTGFWPTQVVASCNLPPVIAHCCTVFREFYLSHHNGRRLTWQTNMGTAQVIGMFGSRRHELTVSTYQMCILLLFNKSEILSFKEIAEATNIPVEDLKRNLLSLSCGKLKVLLKETKTLRIDPADRFAYNKFFKSKLLKVKIVSVQPSSNNNNNGDPNQDDPNGIRSKIDEDRKHQIEACIVRIMKTKKTMEHSNLISETTKQLSSRFLPNPVTIKKRVESLIEREYLERSKTDRKIYHYLA